MSPRHPAAWLISDPRSGDLPRQMRRLPPGTGVVLRHHHLSPAERLRLLQRARRIAAARRLTLVDEAAGTVARVHDARELRQARLRGARLIFLSPLFATRSHPDWRPLPRMRAAALARLGGKEMIALGGMDEGRFAIVRQLGLAGWGGIDGWSRRGTARRIRA